MDDHFSIPPNKPYFVVLDNSGNFKAAYMTPKLINVIKTYKKDNDIHVIRFPTYVSDPGANANAADIDEVNLERVKKLISAIISAGIENLKGIIISGGPLCLSESNPFNMYNINVSFITLFRSTPILGICFGMQVLAACQFGLVKAIHPRTHQVNRGIFKGQFIHDGIFESHDRKGRLPILGLEGPIKWAFHYHSDAVFKLLSPFSRVTLVGLHQGEMIILGFKSNVNGSVRWGLQFHPEAYDETHKYIHNFIDYCYSHDTQQIILHKEFDISRLSMSGL